MVKYYNIIKAIDEELSKTHDGTSSGAIRGSIKEFARKYADSVDKHIVIYDERGYEIKHLQGTEENYYDVEVPYGEIKDMSNLHMVSNVSIDDIYGEHRVANGVSILNPDDIGMLVQKNGQGDYLVKSNTLVSPNNQSMTLIKNDKFNKDNEKGLMKVAEDMNKDYNRFIDERNKVASEKFEELRRERGGTIPDVQTMSAMEDEAFAYADKKVGTVDDFLEQGDYYNKLAENNCKLKVQKNEHY